MFSRMARVLEAPIELDGEVLIEENPHRGSGDLLDRWWQVSGHVSRVANGGKDLVRVRSYASSTASTLSPEPIAPTTVATSMRVPARQGLPNRTLGSIVIPG